MEETFEALICCCLITKSYLTLRDPVDGSPPRSSVHGISQARILEQVAISIEYVTGHQGLCFTHHYISSTKNSARHTANWAKANSILDKTQEAIPCVRNKR